MFLGQVTPPARCVEKLVHNFAWIFVLEIDSDILLRKDQLNASPWKLDIWDLFSILSKIVNSYVVPSFNPTLLSLVV